MDGGAEGGLARPRAAGHSDEDAVAVQLGHLAGFTELLVHGEVWTVAGFP
jgi:hypothetical protein